MTHFLYYFLLYTHVLVVGLYNNDILHEMTYFSASYLTNYETSHFSK